MQQLSGALQKVNRNEQQLQYTDIITSLFTVRQYNASVRRCETKSNLK